MRKKIFSLLFLILCASFFYAEESVDDKVVARISFLFLREYDNVKDKGAIEKIVLRMGRKAYLDNLDLWKKGYSDIYSIKFVLHPIMEQMTKIYEKNMSREKYLAFRKDFEELTKIGFKHFNIYYCAIKEYIIENKISPDNFDLNIFSDALAKPKFFEQKLLLFDEEIKIEDEITLSMKDKKVKYKMAFYAFAFKYFTDMRKNIIDNERRDIQEKLKQKALNSH